MKNLTSLLLIVPLFSILTVQTVRGQTEEEFRQEFLQYAQTHPQSEWEAYAFNRFAQMTINTILQESAWAFIESSFGFTPCLGARQQICDQQFEAEMLQATALTAAAGAACAVVAGTHPLTFAFCIAAVASQHLARLQSASRTHRACYLRARLDCLPPPPPPCPILFGPIANPPIGCNDQDSPIIVDVAGNGFDLTNNADGVMFNLTGLGLERFSWTRADSDDAFLALDLNNNGLIDDGTELFGNFTAQPEPRNGTERNGFAALGIFDSNLDGKIDSQDGVYSELRLWQDINHNGISEPGELHPVGELGLNTLLLNYERSDLVDKHGNEFRYRAKMSGAQLGRWAWDVFLVNSRSLVWLN